MNGLYEITHEFKLASLLAGIRGTFVCLVEKWPKFCPFPSLSLSLVRVEFQYYVLGIFVKTNLNFGNLHQNLSLWSLPNGTYHDNNDLLLGTFSRKAPSPYWLLFFTYIQFFVLFRLVLNTNLLNTNTNVHFVCWPRVHARDPMLVFLNLDLNYPLVVNFEAYLPLIVSFIDRRGLLSFSPI